MSGILGTSGAQEVLPFGVFGDLSNRALNQVFNYNDRARAPRIGRKQIFGSEIGRLSGVNYDKAEMTQYIGAQVSDSKIYDVISKSEGLRKELGAVLPSVQEGGIIIPKALAHELASYRDAQVRLSSKKLDFLFGIEGFPLDRGEAVGDIVFDSLEPDRLWHHVFFRQVLRQTLAS